MFKDTFYTHNKALYSKVLGLGLLEYYLSDFPSSYIQTSSFLSSMFYYVPLYGQALCTALLCIVFLEYLIYALNNSKKTDVVYVTQHYLLNSKNNTTSTI